MAFTNSKYGRHQMARSLLGHGIGSPMTTLTNRKSAMNTVSGTKASQYDSPKVGASLGHAQNAKGRTR